MLPSPVATRERPHACNARVAASTILIRRAFAAGVAWVCHGPGGACGTRNPPAFRFCGHCGSALQAAEASSPRLETEPERRQVTVVFCDLVGSTELSQRVDPEELRDLIGAYRRICADVIARYDGYIARYVGDAILAYFGYPVAHEDDARRSVAAALAIIESLTHANRNGGSKASVRIRGAHRHPHRRGGGGRYRGRRDA